MFVPEEPPELRSERVLLRAPRPDDVEGRRACGKDPAIIRAFGGSPPFGAPVPMTPAEAQSWYDGLRADPNPLHWVVEHDGRFVGTARLHGLRPDDRKARYAVGLLDAGVLGRGLGREVTMQVLRYAFGPLGLHRVDLKVLDFNVRAIRCYRACGFREEGREREAARVDGRWHDDVIMGILARELQEP